MDATRYRLTVRLPEDPAHPGVLHTLGEHEVGMYVHQVRPWGEPFDFRVETRDGVVLRMTGEVVSTRPVPDDYADGCRFDLRVRLLEPPGDWIQLLGQLDRSMDRRATSRIPVAMPVEFIEPPGLGPALTRNIAEGGAFVEVAQDLEVGTVCCVRMSLPGIPGRMYAMGKIVRVADGAVGLEFLDLVHSAGRSVEDALRAAPDDEPVFAVPATELPRRAN